MLTLTSTADTQTIWGPARGYQVAFIHSGMIKINDTTTLEFQNLPVTDFLIISIKNSGYSYFYNGYGNNSFEGNVEFRSVSIGEKPLDYPIGAFPVMLPLSFKGDTNWLDDFTQNSHMTDQVVDDPYYYFRGEEVAKSQDQVTFEFNTSLERPNPTSSYYFNYLPNLSPLQPFAVDGDGFFLVKFMYSEQLGVLYEFTNLVISRNFTDSSGLYYESFHFEESLEFVALIPPIPNVVELFSVRNLILVTLVILYLIVRRYRY